VELADSLERLRNALVALVDAVDREASPANLRTAWTACEREFQLVGTPERALVEEHRELIADIVRLRSLAQERLASGSRDAKEALRSVREAQRSTEFYVPEPRKGRACDVSG